MIGIDVWKKASEPTILLVHWVMNQQEQCPIIMLIPLYKDEGLTVSSEVIDDDEPLVSRLRENDSNDPDWVPCDERETTMRLQLDILTDMDVLMDGVD